ncbi:unnamed protein product, partial [Adineta steineri]
IIHEEILRPKELITKYQLDKSQIAFTLCKKLSDDFYKPYPDSTIISSIITEVPTSKKTNDVTANTSTSLLDTTNQYICCPNCANCFHRDNILKSNQTKKRQSNNRRTSQSSSK